tara:strand:- start:343 stop:696 length:354 start_codon:yes stop_codon:yes gene_type:complete
MNKIGKYSFDSREQAQTKIDALGVSTDEDENEYPTHKHTIVHLGNIVLEQAVIDEDGEIETEAVLSEDWHLDVLWSDLEADEDGTIDHPYGWKSKSVNIDGDGVHAFFGLNYDSLKF